MSEWRQIERMRERKWERSKDTREGRKIQSKLV